MRSWWICYYLGYAIFDVTVLLIDSEQHRIVQHLDSEFEDTNGNCRQNATLKIESPSFEFLYVFFVPLA